VEKMPFKPFIMFPCIEKRAIYDEYGENVRIEDLMVSNDEMDVDREEGKEVMDIEEEEELPTKCLSSTITLPILCEIDYIDFEGRSDGRSIKKIISHVEPRQLILIHGTTESTISLSKYCREYLKDPPKVIETPRVGETVYLKEASNLFRAVLSQQFIDSVNLRPAETHKDYSLTYIDAQALPSEGDSKIHYLQLLPEELRKGHPAIFVGDVKLSNFKQLLQDQNFQTEFKEGVLVVNDTIALRRENIEGQNIILVEGSLSEAYFKVRTILYNQYHIL